MQASKPRSVSYEMPSSKSRISPSKSTKGEIVVSDDDVQVQPNEFLEQNSSTKIAAMAERRIARGLETQQQMHQAQEELKKLRDQLASMEVEKSHVLHELIEMKKVAEDATLSLSEALSAQKLAEDGWEREKIHAKEMEQASIRSAQKRDQAWQLELDAVQRQHALDLEALSSVEQELIRVCQEFSSTINARDEALEEAKDARSVAEANLKLVNDLSKELDLVKESLVSASSNPNGELESKEANGSNIQANPMIELLKLEYEKGKDMKAQLAEREALIANLKQEISDAKDAEMQVADLLSESRTRIEMLELELEKAKVSEAKTFESLISQMKQLEISKISLEEAKFEIASRHENIRSLDASVGQSSKDLPESHRSLEIAKLDTHSVKETIGTLGIDLQTAKEDWGHPQERTSLALSNCSSLAVEISVLRNELKLAKEALAMREVTTEANEANEKLALTQVELQDAKMEIENLMIILKGTEKKFQELLDEARREVDCVKEEAERWRLEVEESHDAWNGKEVGFIQSMKLSEEEIDDAKEENGILIESLIKLDEMAKKAKDENTKLRDILKQAVNEATIATESAEIARTENFLLKNNLSDMGNTLQRITQENERLKINEAAALEQVKELQNLLSVTSIKEHGASKKPNTFAEEPKDSKKTAKLLAEQSKERKNRTIMNGSMDADEERDILKGSINMSWDDFDGSHFDDMGSERSTGTRQRKKKALLNRFSNLLRRKTSGIN